MPRDCYGQPLLGDNLTMGNLGNGAEYGSEPGEDFAQCEKCEKISPVGKIHACCECGRDCCEFCVRQCASWNCHKYVCTDHEGKDLMCPNCEIRAFIIKKLRLWGSEIDDIENVESVGDLEDWWSSMDNMWGMRTIIINLFGEYIDSGITVNYPGLSVVKAITKAYPADRVIAKFQELREKELNNG